MITDTEQFPLSASLRLSVEDIGPELRAICSQNTDRLLRPFDGTWRNFFSAPIIIQRRSEWLEQNVVLDIKAARKKPWSFEGREYLRDEIDAIDDPECRKLTKCHGTGTGKTVGNYGMLLSEFVFNPFPGLYIMPSQRGPGGAENICGELIATLDASPVFAKLLPRGGARKEFITKSKIQFNGNELLFTGGNTPGQVASIRARIVIIGEQDKLKPYAGREAGVDYLAGERTKGMSNTKIVRDSTPSLEGFGIWPHLIGDKDSTGSDCRRRFLPCPHCNQNTKINYENQKHLERNDNYEQNKKDETSLQSKTNRFIQTNGETGTGTSRIQNSRIATSSSNFTTLQRDQPTSSPCPDSALKGWFILIKDDQYNTALPDKLPDGTVIPTAKLRWDAEAKRRDGTWDMDRVVRSARFECPHCGGHIRDEHRIWLDKNGIWLPTRKGEIGHYGFQLSSYYAPLTRDEFGQVDFDSTWGGMAQKFLSAIENGTIGGYINSDLAEVNVNQGNANKIELGGAPISQSDWIPLLTADFQKNHPFIWFVVRKWCAFKLHRPGGLTNGIPDFVAVLDKPGNEIEKKVCHQLQGGDSAAWLAIGELLRFEDPRSSALIEFLLAQKIIGGRLHKIFREDGHGLAMDFRRALYREFSLHLSDGKDANKIRAPRGGDSELIAAGYCEKNGEYAWDELKEYIAQFEIGKGMPLPGRCVGIDCGYAAKFDRQVLRKCHESGTYFKYHDPFNKNKPIQFFKNPPHRRCIPVQADGWFAMKGTPSLRPMGSGKYNIEIGNHVEDPFDGAPADEPYLVEVLDFPQALFWKHKDSLRKNLTKNTYSISPNMDFFPKIYTLEGTPTGASNFKLEDYSRQLNQQYFDEKSGKVEPMAGRGGSQGRKNPYHLDDCETMNLALAAHNDFFDSNQSKT